MGGCYTRLFSLELYFMCIVSMFVCLSCGLVSTPPTFTLLKVKKDDLMFLEVPDGVLAFELHWIQSILSFLSF